jgi:anti-anti-sigma factor
MPNPPEFVCRFEFTSDSTAVVVVLGGRLDSEAVEELHPQIQDLYRAGMRKFAFDLSGLDHAGSLGLRLLVGLQKQVKGQGRVVLCGSNDAVRAMFQMTKLNDILPEFPTRDEALAATAI